jgi:hypothetical protein
MIADVEASQTKGNGNGRVARVGTQFQRGQRVSRAGLCREASTRKNQALERPHLKSDTDRKFQTSGVPRSSDAGAHRARLEDLISLLAGAADWRGEKRPHW